MAQLRDSGDKQALLNYIGELKAIPMVGGARGGEHGLGHRELEDLGIVHVGLEYHGDIEGGLYVENTSGKDIIPFSPENQKTYHIMKNGERQ